LLRRVAQHDVDAFAAFHALTSSRVFGLVARVLRDPGYSEETTQEAILRKERSQVAECLDTLTDAQRECIELAYVVVIDEPTSALDTKLGEQVMELIVTAVRARHTVA
jgi:DNA-directed RNA polymerase specialized sigma24 family protein